MSPIKMQVQETPVKMQVGAARVLYVGGEFYTGACTITPKAEEEVVLPTTGKVLTEDVKVKKIPYFETSNAQNGQTVYIGSEV